MRVIVLALSALCGAAFVATVVLAYVGCFTSSPEVWAAAYVSLILTVACGATTALFWDKATR